MDVSDLRQEFTRAGQVTDRIRTFLADRLLQINGGQGFAPLRPGALGVLHVVPLGSFAADLRLDLTAASPKALADICPIGTNGYNQRINLEGRLAISGDEKSGFTGYAQLFRNGVIEAVEVYYGWLDEKAIAGEAYESDLLLSLKKYFSALQAFGIEAPVFVFFSLLGAKGYRLAVSNSSRFNKHIVDRDVLNFFDVRVDDLNQDPADVMRPIFDSVWNSFGFDRSFNYNEAGEWKGLGR